MQMNNNDAGALLVGGGMMLVFGIIGLAVLVFWVWALVDAIKNPRLTDNERLIWILVIVLASWVGALIYLLAGRKK